MADETMTGPGATDDVARMQEEIRALKNTVSEMGEQLREAAEKQGEELRRTAGFKAEEIGERLQSLGRTMARQGRSQLEGVEHRISERPLESVLVAFGLGIVVSSLLGRR